MEDGCVVSVECALVKAVPASGTTITQIYLRNGESSELAVCGVAVGGPDSEVWLPLPLWSLTQNPTPPEGLTLLQILRREGEPQVCRIRLDCGRGRRAVVEVAPLAPCLRVEGIRFSKDLQHSVVYLANTTNHAVSPGRMMSVSATGGSKDMTASVRGVVIPAQSTVAVAMDWERALQPAEHVGVLIADTNGLPTAACTRADSRFEMSYDPGSDLMRIVDCRWPTPGDPTLGITVYNEIKSPIVLDKVVVAGTDLTAASTLPSAPLPPDSHFYDRDAARLRIPLPAALRSQQRLHVRLEGTVLGKQRQSERCLTEWIVDRRHDLPIGTGLGHPDGTMPLFLCNLRPQPAQSALALVQRAAGLLHTPLAPALGCISLCPGERADELALYPMYCDLLIARPNDLSLNDYLNHEAPDHFVADAFSNRIVAAAERVSHLRDCMAPNPLIVELDEGINQRADRFSGGELRSLIYASVGRGSSGVRLLSSPEGADYREELLRAFRTAQAELSPLREHLLLAHPVRLATCSDRRAVVDTLVCGRGKIVLIVRNANESASVVSNLPYHSSPLHNLEVLIKSPPGDAIQHVYEATTEPDDQGTATAWHSKGNTVLRVDRVTGVRLFLLSATAITTQGLSPVQCVAGPESPPPATDAGIECKEGNYRSLGFIASDITTSVAFALANRSAEPRTLEWVGVEGDEVTIDIPRTPIQPGECVAATLRIPQTTREGQFASRVHLRSAAPTSQPVVLEVSGFRRPAVAVTPRQLDFGTFYSDSLPTLGITLKPNFDRDFKVLGGADSCRFVNVEVKDGTLLCTPNVSEVGPFQGEVVLTTSSQYAPTIRIPVRGTVCPVVRSVPESLTMLVVGNQRQLRRALSLVHSPALSPTIEAISAELPDTRWTFAWGQSRNGQISINCDIDLSTLQVTRSGSLVLTYRDRQGPRTSLKIPVRICVAGSEQ